MTEDYSSPTSISASTIEMKIQPKSFRCYQSPYSKQLGVIYLRNHYSIDVLMNPAQNLIIIVYAITKGIFQPGDVKFFIELGALDGGGAHPQAAGRTLSVSGPPQCENICLEPNSGKLKGLERRITLWCTLRFDDAGSFTRDRTIWWLQIWDW
ncbi:uncharacterized protein F5147DRAFT_649417 [Suillus discolor]|uniref:Uncharacterized protein n=1 Tax=Suillus discolor TaxID=1912936 RepID=A0A9P7FFZ7_9AGAM|nr:uncharacterized protein F5147DRAFT_649417 [Suillus discolor]KAG2116042.1 hypothetical protein F5147DRAFT_649417 [Suillus discolor]